MAIITRRYAFVGPPDSQLAREVGAAVQDQTYPTTALDIDIDNAVDDAVETLDEFMLLNGWIQDSEFTPIDGISRSALIWGNSDIGPLADTRFLSPGHDFILASATDVLQIPLSRDGASLSRFTVRHNSAPLTGVGDAVYTVMVNGVATALTVTLTVGVVDQDIDLVNSTAISSLDRVSIRVTKAGGIVDGLVDVQASLEYSVG